MDKLKKFEDERGCLIPLEFDTLPFIPKRVFVVNNVPLNFIRGNHSHYKTKQFLICVNGSVDVILNDGKIEITHKLNAGDTILIPELIWDSQKFTSKNSEIMVLCSTKYNHNDYIFDFEYFKKIKNV